MPKSKTRGGDQRKQKTKARSFVYRVCHQRDGKNENALPAFIATGCTGRGAQNKENGHAGKARSGLGHHQFRPSIEKKKSNEGDHLDPRLSDRKERETQKKQPSDRRTKWGESGPSLSPHLETGENGPGTKPSFPTPALTP